MNGTTILTQRARLTGGKAYDSDPHDQILLNKYEIELIASHRKNRKKAKIQDGRKLRPYKRRWKVKVERVFAWIYNFRRIVVRYEHRLENYLAFVLLACIKMLLRKF